MIIENAGEPLTPEEEATLSKRLAEAEQIITQEKSKRNTALIASINASHQIFKRTEAVNAILNDL